MKLADEAIKSSSRSRGRALLASRIKLRCVAVRSNRIGNRGSGREGTLDPVMVSEFRGSSPRNTSEQQQPQDTRNIELKSIAANTHGVDV